MQGLSACPHGAPCFFAGHGSQTPDTNGDEPDGWDETILLQDARSGGVHDLVDDELNGMLGELYQKTEHVVVLDDSCNSATMTRAADATDVLVRMQPPEHSAPRAAGPSAGLEKSWVPKEMAHARKVLALLESGRVVEWGGHAFKL